MSGMCCKCGVAHVTPEETAEIDRLRAAPLDVERLARALAATGALWSSNDYYEVTTDADEFATAIAREYAALGDRAAEEGR